MNDYQARNNIGCSPARTNRGVLYPIVSMKMSKKHIWNVLYMALVCPLICPLYGQPENLLLSGPLWGNYTAQNTIEVEDAFVVNDLTLNIGTCDDDLIPAIGVLLDSCIRDEEWLETYFSVLVDSAAFYTQDALDLFVSFGIGARDDCGIDTFGVIGLQIIPPGGIHRTTGTKEFRVQFRAIDFVGRVREEVMIWIRDESGCL